MALHLVDLVIALTLLELLVLVLYHRNTGSGIATRDILPTLAAGLALMLAVRAGLSDAHWGLVSAALLGAGLAHLADLRRRWRHRR